MLGLFCYMKSSFANEKAIQTGMASKGTFNEWNVCGQDCHRVQNYYKSQRPMFGPLFAEKVVGEYALATN